MQKLAFIIIGALLGAAVAGDLFIDDSKAEDAALVSKHTVDGLGTVVYAAPLIVGAIIGGAIGQHTAAAFAKRGQELSNLESYSALAFVGMIVLELFVLG